MCAGITGGPLLFSYNLPSPFPSTSRHLWSVWLAQLVEALAAPTHVSSCVQAVWVRSLERTCSTLIGKMRSN